jgi:N,N-dimethylformamidase
VPHSGWLPSRRHVLLGASAGIVGSLIEAPKLAGAAPVRVPATFDPQQRFSRLVPGGNGVLYAVVADGSLEWHRHAGWENGSSSWALGSGRRIGAGWHTFERVLAGSDGQLLAFRPDGSCLWFRWLSTDEHTGAGAWAKGSGSVIGRGFNRYPRLFGGFDGVFYATDAAGNLFWFRYLDGHWTNNGVARRIAGGWSQYVHLFADPLGVIYGVRQGGVLDWWRYSGDGVVGEWSNGSQPVPLTPGWYEYSNLALFSNGGGTIYGVAIDRSVYPGPDSVLNWYRLSNSQNLADTGKPDWVRRAPTAVGADFTYCASAPLQGYLLQRSVAPGDLVRPAVSSTLGPVSLSVTRLSTGSAAAVWGPVEVPATLQQLPPDYRSAGCGWKPSAAIPVGAGWPSGVYAVQAVARSGRSQLLPFVVRPQRATAPIAFVLPTNTYNAYNAWGGHNQYTAGQAGVQRTVTFHRPSDQNQTSPTGIINHTLYSDLLLLRWMAAQGIAYDCYDDGDVTDDATWLEQYRAVVLGSHPEYWSAGARQQLVGYLQAGGRLISTGGNAIYEQVAFTADRNAVVFRTPTGARNTFASLGEPSEQLLGVSLQAPAYLSFAPYRVLLDHPILAGTGLVPGGQFGAAGYNGAASGWEVDARHGLPGQATDAEVIAAGENAAGGAELVFRATASGGWIFSASSIAFNGAVSSDPVLARILSNVLAMGAAPRTPVAPALAQRASRQHPGVPAPGPSAAGTPAPATVPGDGPVGG